MTDAELEPCMYCGADVSQRTEHYTEQGVTTSVIRRMCTDPDCVTRTPGAIVTP
ncbi:hypothetical protein ACX12M_15755 [Cellulosimicrobium cellulans]